MKMKIKKITTLAGPEPPEGSDYDQSTIDKEPNAAILIAGERQGEPSIEHYVAQSMINDRIVVTGYGGMVGYTEQDGPVTENLIIGLANEHQKNNYPQEPSKWLVAAKLNPSQLEPDNWYYISLDFSDDPITLNPDQTIYLIAVTNNPGGENRGWAWLGFDHSVYPKGNVSIYNGQEWNEQVWETMFWTWTETEGPQPECEDYNNQADCLANNCYWYNNSCHNSPQNGDEPDWQKYLPYIIAGIGGVVLVGAVLMETNKK